MASLSGGWIALFLRTDRIRGTTAAQVLLSAEIFEIWEMATTRILISSATLGVSALSWLI